MRPRQLTAQEPVVLDLCSVRLRSNPRLRLVPYDRLPPSQRDLLGSLSGDRDFFGILEPATQSGLPAKSVSRDAALLFLVLAEPACLPNLLSNLLGAGAHARLRQLVLDQVFEVEQDGEFVSGPAALRLLGHEPDGQSDSRVAQLSSEAIDYARALESLTAREVAAHLYLFNAAPSTPALQRRFASDDRLRSFLYAGTDAERWLRSKWRGQSVEDSWLAWSAPTAAAAAYKLYVSPVLDDLPRVFGAAVHAFAQADCSCFKLGRGAYGVLRPDKLVAYFPSLDRLQRAAALIEHGTRGAVCQGVPFSAPIDKAGLLSWGMDPPPLALMPGDHAVPSWRQWLSERIAAYVVAARHSGDDVQTFVRQRIGLDGVDPANWTPSLAIWRSPSPTGPGVP